MTTFTCQVYSTTTILQVWDTNCDTVDKETKNWLIPHFIHHILVNFVLCEQFTDNLLMAHLTSKKEAVLAILKKVGRHDITLVQKQLFLHNTFDGRVTVGGQTVHNIHRVLVLMALPHGITCGTQRHSVLYNTVGGVVGQEGSIESMCSKRKSVQNAQVHP